MYVYEIATVVAPKASDTFDVALNSTTTYEYFTSQMSPRSLADHLRGCGNRVEHIDKGLVNRQMLYVNWREVGDLAFPDGIHIRVCQTIGRTEQAAIDMICKRREKT